MKPLTEEQKQALKQKFQDKLDELDRTQKTYATMSALHTLAQYWVENEIIIERAAVKEVGLNGPQWNPDPNDEDSLSEFFAERGLARDLHDNTLIPMHRYSSIVMLYSTVERELLRLVENLELEHGPQKLKWKDIRANSKVEQISRFCEVFFKVRLADCSNYEAVTELQKIRDCIVHCLGHVSLSSDKDFLVTLHKKRRGLYVSSLTEIDIEDECIKQFLQEIWSFFVSVFKILNWEIATHWHGDKLGKIFERINK